MFWSIILIILAHERVYVWAAGVSLHEDHVLSERAVHEEFGSRFSTRVSLSRAVDDLVERLMREEEEACRQQEQCDNDADEQQAHKPENIVAPPTAKPDDGADGEEGQDQGHEGEHGGQDGGSNHEAAPGKKFYIESTFSGKVVEITPGGDQVEGAKIQMWEKRGSSDARQLWVLSEENTIRSALHTNMEFTDSSKEESRLAQALRALLEDGSSVKDGLERVGDLKGLEMHLVKSHYKGGGWRQKGEMIVNEAGYALTIRDASRENGARLIQHDAEPEAHKNWRLVYV